MQFITFPLLVGIITFGVYKLFELFVRRRERMMLIEKLEFTQLADLDPTKVVDGTLSQRLDRGSRSVAFKVNVLTIGCLLIGVGLGFLICFILIPHMGLLQDDWEARQVVIISSVLLFGGLGLIASVFLQRFVERQK